MADDPATRRPGCPGARRAEALAAATPPPAALAMSEPPPFRLPEFRGPDLAALASCPVVRWEPSPADGVAPDGFHATSNHPEYLQLAPGRWELLRESRMDSVPVLRPSGAVEVVEPRRLKRGDPVAVGRRENGEDGIFVHVDGFQWAATASADKFSFRSRGTRETPFSRSYDDLYALLRHDRIHGRIVWVLGPAVAFDRDSRDAMAGLIGAGYCHALLAGNALATHDLEGALFRTGLGQDIYSQAPMPLGHYNHLDVINAVRGAGSIPELIRTRGVRDGIVHACHRHGVPMVLAGSIRDDGPLPEVIGNCYDAQDAMRAHARTATVVIALATQLHTIAFGNMVPGYRVMADGAVRPVYLYVVDMSEFSTDKLANRGSAQAQAILTNAQDFLINLWRNLA